MTKKPERVPGMREPTPNRRQRRHPDSNPEESTLTGEERAPKELDVPDPRAKRSGHKKKTAENWNQ